MSENLTPPPEEVEIPEGTEIDPAPEATPQADPVPVPEDEDEE